nr:transcription factor bHLH112-like [Ipomoea batatas]
MADDFMTAAGVCGGGSWWNPARSMFGASPCSAASINDMGNFAWANNNDDHHHHHHHNQLVNMKGRSSEESSEGSSVVLQELPKSHHHQTHNMSMDNSTLHMLGIGLSPSSTATSDWNQALVVQTNERAMLQEDRNSRLNYGQEIGVECSDSSFKQIVAKDFSNSNPSVTNFAPSYNNYPSNLLQTLLDSDPQPQQQQPLLSNQQISYAPAPANFRPNLNDFSPPLLKPTFPASFWNQSPASLNDGRAAFLPSTQSQFLPSVFSDKSKPSRKSSNVEEARQSSAMAKKASNEEPAFKRPRIETPSPLPTFKVRKEKLGDRVTALQQLVSPFGKTDTASVLHEAIEYIKFLHDQVNVLSAPYLKNGCSVSQHHQQDQEGRKAELRSRGLCLVPISSTFPVATETSSDFWTPTFGASFR